MKSNKFFGMNEHVFLSWRMDVFGIESKNFILAHGFLNFQKIFKAFRRVVNDI